MTWSSGRIAASSRASHALAAWAAAWTTGSSSSRSSGLAGARGRVLGRLVLAVVLPGLEVGGQRPGRVAVGQAAYGVDERRVDGPAHRAVAGAGPEVDQRAEPPARGERLGPVGEVVEGALVGVEELVSQGDHHGGRLLTQPGGRHERQERPGAPVGGLVAPG